MKEPGAVDVTLAAGLWRGIRLRGPDDEGGVLINRQQRQVWPLVSERTQASVAERGHQLSGPLPRHDVALFHARYAVIDLSAGAHQPFRSQDGSCFAVFNGEIYNYRELRAELKALGVAFRTASDTEVLVEGWRQWGHGLWARMNGFWAVALYDAASHAIVLSRDRLGVAPCYYRETASGFYFASLIRPLQDIAPGGEKLDPDVVRGFLDTGLKDHDGSTFYSEVRSLPPGTSVTFPLGGDTVLLGADIRPYWELPAQPFSEKSISFTEAVKLFRTTFIDAVSLRLRADLPIAFELSGGLDSSSVVAAAAEILDRPLTAYTIQVRDKDETRFARALARRFRIDHHVLKNMEESLPNDAEAFSVIMEEPYDTPANYTHHLMLRRIKADGFHVILTGAGGDETLAGYEASFWPAAWREWRARGPLQVWAADWYEFCRRFRTTEDAQRTLGSYWRALSRKVRPTLSEKRKLAPSRALDYVQSYRGTSFYQQRLFHCRIGLLPYYLRSTDHYTMNIPLEHRFPFLDYRLVELGMRLPVPYLFRAGWTKFVLRKAMESYLPPLVLWRKRKMGFPFAFASYFLPRSNQFEKYLRVLETCGFRRRDDGSYAELAGEEPERLWRQLSVGIWLTAEGSRRQSLVK